MNQLCVSLFWMLDNQPVATVSVVGDEHGGTAVPK